MTEKNDDSSEIAEVELNQDTSLRVLPGIVGGF